MYLLGDRKKRLKFSERTLFGKLLFIVRWLVLVMLILSPFVGYGVYEYDKRTDWLSEALDLPPVTSLYDADLREQSDIVGDDGRRVSCFSSPEHRIKILAPEDIPPIFEAAIIAQEDQRFYEHAGVDLVGVGRAVVSNFSSGRIASGASTLEMQIAKNLLLKDTSKSYARKAKEAILAVKIDREFSKREVLLLYVNMMYLERGQYGIEAASRSYFGKSAKDLAVEEAAFIVSLINKPRLARSVGASLDTSADRRESVKRTRHVIDRLYDSDYFSEHGGDAEYERALAAAAKLKFLAAMSGCSTEIIGPYYMEAIRLRHKDRLQLNTGGLQIFLPIDPELQRVAEEALKEGLNVYRSRHTFSDEVLAKRAAQAGMTLAEFKVAQEADRESIRGLAFGVDFAGRVRFLIGGEDWRRSKFNVATQGFRQPGSTFKAFTYAALSETLFEDLAVAGVPEDRFIEELERRCRVVDAPVAVGRGAGKPPKWISNFRSNNQPLYRGEMSCRMAVAESRNTAAIRAGRQAGVKHMVELGRRLGLGTGERNVDEKTYELQPYPTTAIGASDVVPIDMAAYLSFVNGGYKVPLIWEYDICRKRDRTTLESVLFTDLPDPLDPSLRAPRSCNPSGSTPETYERVLHPAVAEHVKRMLQGPVDEETGTAHSLRKGATVGSDPLKWEPKAKRIAFPFDQAGEIAAKTGTATNTNGETSDVWFIVLVPGQPGKPETGMLMIFWMGKTTKANLGNRETGGRNLVPVAAKVMKFLQEKRGLLRPGHRFEALAPAGIGGGVGKGIEPFEGTQDGSEIIDPLEKGFDPKLHPELPFTPPPENTESEEEKEGSGATIID